MMAAAPLRMPVVNTALFAALVALPGVTVPFRKVWERIRILFANGYYLPNAVAIVGLDAIADNFDTGTAAVIRIYSGSVPADADTALGAQVVLAELTMSATAFGNAVDLNPGARVTANAITADASADATGTASFFRVFDQAGGTIKAQGTVGTASADMLLNTTNITAGSNVSISSYTMTLPEGP